MSYELPTITTNGGQCPSHVLTDGTGAPSPAVIFFMDAAGVRPGALGMARRLAQAGYVVLFPDLFYRYGPYGPFEPREVFGGDFRSILSPLVATTSNAKVADETGAFLAYLDTRSDICGHQLGAVGFCMGGGMAIAAAGSHPDRFAAVASFHGGNLATDAVDSPHRYASDLKAELYIAAAENDPSYPGTMATRFEQALQAADVQYRSETYPAPHGWMMPDFPYYDEAQAERGWSEMLSLFARTLPSQRA